MKGILHATKLLTLSCALTLVALAASPTTATAAVFCEDQGHTCHVVLPMGDGTISVFHFKEQPPL